MLRMLKNVLKRLIKEEHGGVGIPISLATAGAAAGIGFLLILGGGIVYVWATGGFEDPPTQVYLEQEFQREEGNAPAQPQEEEEEPPPPPVVVEEETIIEEEPEPAAPQPEPHAPSGGSSGGSHPAPQPIQEMPQ